MEANSQPNGGKTPADFDMPSFCNVLLEEQFYCSICLDVFSDPVSIFCGHNFCKACISQYWDSAVLCQCPLCKEQFDIRPKLCTNTFISEMATQFRKSICVNNKLSLHQLSEEPGKMVCDVCNGTKLRALKSCLECQTSYCETHLEPHHRVAGLRRHKLINPVANLEDRMCKKHDRYLELFCMTDQMCVCQYCTEADHKTHHTVSLEEECRARKAHLGKMEAEMQQLIQERRKKVQEIKRSVELSKKDAEREIEDSMQVFTALVRSVQRSQAKFAEVIKERERENQRRSEELVSELEKEITELQRSCTELEVLSHTEDHLHLLQRSTFNLPPKKDWSDIRVHSDLCVGNMTRALFQMEETSREFRELEEKFNTAAGRLCDDALRMMRQYSVDVTLDSDTAFPFLSLSKDKKEVMCASKRKDYPICKKRFNNSFSVLGNEGFSSGRFYYEVEVKGKTWWWLGVASESIVREGNSTVNSDRLWTVWLNGQSGYGARSYYPVPLSLRKKPQKVGVFVDYENGHVSFYDVEARFHIYSFNGCLFTEKLFPYFNPYLSCSGENSAPLVISPVTIIE
ncbi:hypothetical protein UPYG_G00074310 [Umbra pygmaea]|uniref:Uncharacterized protein n=1 Tax=Umbra pygmaea TaxID=75934 RepID=A0ABD0XCE0_UMBPY